MNASTKFEKNDGVLASDAGEEILMLDIDRGLYYGLSDVAVEIWNFLDAEKSADAIVEKLIAQYDIDPEVCLVETLAFLESLQAQGIIQAKD